MQSSSYGSCVIKCPFKPELPIIPSGSYCTAGRRILSCVAAKLARYAEVSISVRVVAGVAGPQAGKDLSHGAELLLHLSLADALAVDGELARSHAMRKNLEKGDGIGDVREVGVKVELRAEL